MIAEHTKRAVTLQFIDRISSNLILLSVKIEFCRWIERDFSDEFA